MASLPPFDELSAAQMGMLVNAYGGVYEPGKKYSMERKLRVFQTLVSLKEDRGGVNPSARALASAAQVGRDYAQKIIDEVSLHGRVLRDDEVQEDRLGPPRGPGVLALSPDDELCLLALRYDDPTQPLVRYRTRLFQLRGTIVSESTLSDWFLRRFPHKASLKKVNLVPLDKFKPENIVTYVEYINFILPIHRPRLHFGDEKSLKGAELFERKCRPNPITGVQDVLPNADPDFRNTYCILGMMTLNPCKQPFVYSIGTEHGDSAAFFHFIMDKLLRGWFQRWDIVVLDNATIHHQGECDGLADFLWNVLGPDGQPMRILLVPFPTRAPEMNPIEKLWNILVQRLKTADLRDPFRPHSHAAAIFAELIMQQFTHDLMVSVAKDCGY